MLILKNFSFSLRFRTFVSNTVKVNLLKSYPTTQISIPMKRLALVMFAIYICVLVPASPVLTWLDVTESYIVNPGFEKSTDGWLIDSEMSNARAEYGGMEFWNG